METKRKKGTFPFLTSIVLGTLIGFFVMFLTYFNFLGELENTSYDLRFSWRGVENPNPHILIVGITDESLRELGRWPWEREVHADLLNILTEGNAKVIGMDIIFAEPSREREMDEALVNATAKSVPVVYPTEAPPGRSDIPGFLSPQTVSYPIPQLMDIADAGFINVAPDRDVILRRALLWMEHENTPIPSFDLLVWAIAQGFTAEELNQKLLTQFEPAPTQLTLGDTAFPLDMSGSTLINYKGGRDTFPVLPYHLVLEGAYPPSLFEDAIVLVGYYSDGLGDYFFTPFTRDTPMYGVEAHANIVNTLLEGEPIQTASLATNLALPFLLAFGSMLIYQALKPVYGFVTFVVMAGAFFVISIMLFNNQALYIETVYSLVALSGSYVTALVYNFVVEQRDRQRVTRLFGRYVAPQVVDEILQVGEENLKLGGTKRRITLLFIDIRGFTPLSEKLPPEEVVKVLNEYFEIVTRCIFENKGTIDKFMGDAAMALFNAPLIQDDHALWAVRAAKAITDEGVALQNKVYEMSGVHLHFGIGINTGDVIVGNIGAENRMEYTAIGDAVNLAARLESNAKKGQVLISEEVYKEVDSRMPLAPVGEISVKGKSKPVMVYELVKESPESEEAKSETSSPAS